MSDYELNRENFQRLIDLADKVTAEVERAKRRADLWQIATWILLTYVVIAWIR